MPGVYKIGVVSHKTGLSASTLRQWEDQYGILAPARTRGGTRLYSESDIERVLYVRHLVRDRGYALDAIGAIVDDVASNLPYSLDRVAIENIYLRDATNHSEIEEGRRMARVHTTMRSLVHAESGLQAATALVAAVKALTGAQTAALGLCRRKTDTLLPVATARGDGIHTSTGIPPLQISEFPRDWQTAIDACEPYAAQDLLRLDLPGDVNLQVAKHRTRSFHAEPLTIAHDLVGLLIVTSARPGGVGREAERVCEELAIAAGPAIHYFARQLESTSSSQPRL
jgi:DNA-binding transcriptional MerR regulator